LGELRDSLRLSSLDLRGTVSTSVKQQQQIALLEAEEEKWKQGLLEVRNSRSKMEEHTSKWQSALNNAKEESSLHSGSINSLERELKASQTATEGMIKDKERIQKENQKLEMNLAQKTEKLSSQKGELKELKRIVHGFEEETKRNAKLSASEIADNETEKATIEANASGVVAGRLLGRAEAESEALLAREALLAEFAEADARVKEATLESDRVRDAMVEVRDAHVRHLRGLRYEYENRLEESLEQARREIEGEYIEIVEASKTRIESAERELVKKRREVRDLTSTMSTMVPRIELEESYLREGEYRIEISVLKEQAVESERLCREAREEEERKYKESIEGQREDSILAQEALQAQIQLLEKDLNETNNHYNHGHSRSRRGSLGGELSKIGVHLHNTDPVEVPVGSPLHSATPEGRQTHAGNPT